MNKVLKTMGYFIKEKKAFAHCDIPCGIYDPHQAQLAAHTIIRMTKLLSEINQEDVSSSHAISRMTRVKEKHSDILEEELETLRNDYFKDDHFKDYKNLNDLFVVTLRFSAKARQGIDMEAAQSALLGVLEIAEIFYKTKGVNPVRVKSVYPTEGEIVIYE